mgnify:CR=1 FL=1
MQSEEDENLRVEYDSDEFADDEGMSNLEDEDSSSQEYLHDENPPPFLADEFRSSSRHKKYTTGWWTRSVLHSDAIIGSNAQ